MKNKIILLFIISLITFSFSNAFANKTSVEIKAPETIQKGSEITIVINVIHNGNTKSHHTEWVVLKVNGQEVKKWTYDKKNLPPDGNFTVEYKITAEEEIVIEAEGNCNLHGTKGPAKTTIKVV